MRVALITKCVWLPLGTEGTPLGVVPPSELLKGMVQLPPGYSAVPPDHKEGVLPRDDNKGSAVNKEQHNPPPDASSKQYLVVSGLPTIPQKLAQRIWEFDFIEEFLPTNKTIQALELAVSKTTRLFGHFMDFVTV